MSGGCLRAAGGTQVVWWTWPQLQLLPVGVIFGVQNMHEPKPLITLLATVPEPPNVMLFH